MSAGMLRLVFGLGTRAVERTVGDYARVVSLDNPRRLPPMHSDDRRKYSQHGVDLISFCENELKTRPADEVLSGDIGADRELFASPDWETERRLRELGREASNPPVIVDFDKLLRESEFPEFMREILKLLERIYDYPVDIEFTANFDAAGRFMVNLLQCRPLQTRGLGKAVDIPVCDAATQCLIYQKGNFMGGNVRLKIDYVVYISPAAYRALGEQQKHTVARQVGRLNTLLKGKNTLLLGPGRWGTTTASLGVPVRFSEICNMAAVGEVASQEAGFAPELSYGSHFFQDLVETGIFYMAVFAGQEGVIFRPEQILKMKNILPELLPDGDIKTIHAARTDGMELYSDIVTQTLLCR
jgi:hypothetical protein